MMKSSTPPIICGAALACMSAAGLSHWWSISQFAAHLESAPPTSHPAPVSEIPKRETTPSPQPLAAKTAAPETGAPPARKEFYEALLAEMKKLRTENRDLLDQMAETNREVMQLGFRVDTHSESFRPLHVSEERIDTVFDGDEGVLPPRAEPVYPFFNE